MKKEVWVLMYVDNDYNQPEKAFAELYWQKPTYKELKEHGFNQQQSEAQCIINTHGNTEYWIEKFQQK